jgi:HK97 family phage portal protein
MGLISEYRSSLENPQTPLSFPAEWLLDIFNGGRTDSGIRVSELTALQVTTVYACVEIKAGAIGALDLKIFEKIVQGDGRVQRRIAHDHDYWDLLEHEPNDEMSSFTMRKCVQAHRMLWGNGYIEIQRDGGDRVVALWPRNPARTKVRRAREPMLIRGELIRTGQLFYATTEGMETAAMDVAEGVNEGYTAERPILPADMISLPGLALDGRVGQDVIQLARNAVGLALATEKFGGKFFGNGALGYGIFKLPGTLTPEDFQSFVREVQEAWGGENAQRPLVLQGGEDYTPTSTKPNEGQFIETRKHQVEEICRIFGVPPHMVGLTEKTSRANTEQMGQEFVTFALAPDLKCWEQEIKRKMFPRPAIGRNAGKKFGAFFDTRPLTMPAANDLRAFIQAMIQWGVMEPNDAREWMSMNPLTCAGADATWMQINMAPVDQLYETPALPGAGGDPDAADDGNESDEDDAKPAKGKGNQASKRSRALVERVSRVYSRLFRDAFGRMASRSNLDLAAFRQVFLPVLVSIGEELERYAAQMFPAELSPEALSSSSFLAGYLETMLHRARNEKWATANGNTDAIAQKELLRAVRALAVEAWRNAATAAAKQETEVIAP